MLNLCLKPLLVPGDVCHIAVSTVSASNPTILHDHDFVEIFLILGGAGWHLINGKKIPLKTGDFVFIRSTDRHAFATGPDGELRLLNLAFLSSWFARFRFLLPAETPVSGWMKDKMPPSVHLSRGVSESLERRGDDLILSKSPRHYGLAQFCLEAFVALEGPLHPKKDISAPEWLTRCITAMDQPENLPKDLAYFQKLAGRSPEHLARLCRLHFGVPPTELLNQARIQYAKRELLDSTAKVIDIAYDCGFQNVGYFHRTFLRLSGLTPRYWRFKHRPITVPR